MKEGLKKFGQSLMGVAPTIANVLLPGVGGVVVGTAVSAVSKAIGAPDGTPPDKLAAIMEGGLPVEKLEALRRADTEFAARMKELDIDLEKVHAGDRGSARKMRIEMGGDWTSNVLSYLSVALFGGLVGSLIYMALHGVQVTSDMKELLIYCLGHASGFASSVFLFHFGSSSVAKKSS